MSSLRQLFPRPLYHVVTCPHRGTSETFINSEIQYDVFIFDHEVEDRCAFDLLRLVRTLDHRKQTPVIIVGGEEETSLSEFTKASGGNAYVRKAKEYSAVHRRIARLLAESIDDRPNSESGTASPAG